MATSGTLNGNNVDGTEGSYLDWQLVSQNVSDNYSVINWQVGWRFSTTSCRGLRLGAANINGSPVYNDSDPGDGVHTYNSSHNHKPKLQTASGQVTIYHNADGTKTFSASVTMTGWQGLKSSGSTNFTLPTIPRKSSPPSMPLISSITNNSVFVTFEDGTGGAPIDSREIGYGTNPTTPQTIVPSDGSTTISGLSPGTTYYFWARTHNAAGYSDWSPRASATTHRVPDAPNAAGFSSLTQTSVSVSWTANGNGGAPITGYDIGYGTNSSSPTTIISASTSPKTVTGLEPGTLYYFWVRAKNYVGASPWSAKTSVETIAGAWVKVGSTWKKAIPYVNVNGVWKLARVWVRSAGTWKETS